MMPSQAEQMPCIQNTDIPEQQRQEAARKKLDIQEYISSGLTRLCLHTGERMNPSHLVRLNHAINFLEVGQWLKENGYSFRNAPRFRDRGDLYTALARKIEQEVVLYLEFGVWQGASLRTWSHLLRNPLSSLHGFDSFEGLPEAWDRFPKGTFDVKGVLPQFDDPRIILHQGWFHETLPDFVLPAHERLLLNLDADLYSSTRYVLDTLGALGVGKFFFFHILTQKFFLYPLLCSLHIVSTSLRYHRVFFLSYAFIEQLLGYEASIINGTAISNSLIFLIWFRVCGILKLQFVIGNFAIQTKVIPHPVRNKRWIEIEMAIILAFPLSRSFSVFQYYPVNWYPRQSSNNCMSRFVVCSNFQIAKGIPFLEHYFPLL